MDKANAMILALNRILKPNKNEEGKAQSNWTHIPIGIKELFKATTVQKLHITGLFH